MYVGDTCNNVLLKSIGVNTVFGSVNSVPKLRKPELGNKWCHAVMTALAYMDTRSISKSYS